MSTSPVMYGQTPGERRADENNVCRQIVKEINNFGITQRQSLVVIYLMALELEDAEKMRSITRLVRELAGDELFLIGPMEPDAEVPCGTTDT